MERLHLTFLFRIGQRVCYIQPDGPSYVVQARVYVEGAWPTGYTAGVPTALSAGPHTLYLLAPEHNILGTFWAHEKDLYRTETHHAPTQQ